jgi:hypothetical protein
MALAGVNGRIDTTIGPWKRPAGLHGMLVVYMETFVPASRWRSAMPASTIGSSKENEQPRTKLTRSSRQISTRRVGSSTHSPSRNTR